MNQWIVESIYIKLSQSWAASPHYVLNYRWKKIVYTLCKELSNYSSGLNPSFSPWFWISHVNTKFMEVCFLTEYLNTFMYAYMLNHVWLFATLLTLAHQALLFMGFFWQKTWSVLSFSPPWDLPDPVIKPMAPVSPALAGGFFTTSVIWEANNLCFASWPTKNEIFTI